MIIQEDREEQLAAARRLPTTAEVQLPDKSTEAPTYVRSDASQPSTPATLSNGGATGESIPQGLKPIDSSVKTLDIRQTADTPMQSAPAEAVPGAPGDEATPPVAAGPRASLRMATELPDMKAGERVKVAIYVDGSAAFRSAVLGLRFDEKLLAVRGVQFGDVFGGKLANAAATPFLNQSGKMFVSLSTADNTVETTSGVIAYVEIEALADGKPQLTFDKDVLNLLTSDGKNFAVSF
jgi:hypothetical protein